MKDLYTLIKENKDGDIRKLVSKKIEAAKKEAKRVNRGDYYFFGINFDKAPATRFNSNFSWLGFIDNDVKIGYAIGTEGNYFSDKGSYYYIDDEEFIYDFAYYIKDKEANEFEDFTKYLCRFINEYYMTEKYYYDHDVAERTKLFRPIVDKTGENYYPQTEKHSIKEFYATSIAECMEYTVMAQNILAVFGYRTYAILGSFVAENPNGFHAFNIIDFDSFNTLIDFGYQIKRFNINGEMIPSIPFMVDLTEEEVKKVENRERLDFNEQEAVNINGKDFYFETDKIRSYVPFRCRLYDFFERIKVNIKYE